MLLEKRTHNIGNGSQTWSTSEKSRLHSTETADSTSKTDDRLNQSTQLSPTLSTQLDFNVKRPT